MFCIRTALSSVLDCMQVYMCTFTHFHDDPSGLLDSMMIITIMESLLLLFSLYQVKRTDNKECMQFWCKRKGEGGLAAGALLRNPTHVIHMT